MKILSVISIFLLAACSGNEVESAATVDQRSPPAKTTSPTATSATAEQASNAAANTYTVLSEPMLIPGLERQRNIRIYLPPDYSASHPGYPVLYMHDAQNLFDEATSYAGEWQVDETLNKLAAERGVQIIVVGIDNGEEKRVTELSAWDHPEYGKAEGKQYTDFIVHTLKPFIDKNYNTNSSDSGIMGSSLGGLSSHYAIYQYPDVFSRAGIFSPSYWYSEKVYEFTRRQPIPNSHRLFLTVGELEGENMTEPMQRMAGMIRNSGHENIHSDVDPKGEHNEAFWARRFEEAILWLYEIK